MSSSGGQTPAGWYPEPGTGRQRWWDGTAWGSYHDSAASAPPPLFAQPGAAPSAYPGAAPHTFAASTPTGYAPPGAYASAYGAQAARPTNGIAIAALILGIWGFVTTWIPFFIGLFLGGIPDILAIIFGIIGIVRARRLQGVGLVPAIVGLVLGGLAFLSILVGAGWLW